MDVEQWKERAKKYRNQSSEVKTNEAYKALLHEIANAEDEVAKAEDRLLDRMVAGEEYERQVKAAEAAVKEVEAAANVERHTIQAEYNAAQKELAAAEAVRAAAVAAVPGRFGRSLRAHRETPRRHRPGRNSRRRLRPVRRPHPAARDPAIAARWQRRILPLRDVHAHPLLRRSLGSAGPRVRRCVRAETSGRTRP